MNNNEYVGRWHVESDGEIHARTFYAWRDNSAMPCGIERKDFPTREKAALFAATENAFVNLPHKDRSTTP